MKRRARDRLLEVERWNHAEDGRLSEEALRGKLESRGYRVSRYVYPPGTHFAEHTHEIDKIDAVLSGQFRMTTLGGSVVLGSGDCLEVPRGTVHSAEVVGDEPVVSLDATRSP